MNLVAVEITRRWRSINRPQGARRDGGELPTFPQVARRRMPVGIGAQFQFHAALSLSALFEARPGHLRLLARRSRNAPRTERLGAVGHSGSPFIADRLSFRFLRCQQGYGAGVVEITAAFAFNESGRLKLTQKSPKLN